MRLNLISILIIISIYLFGGCQTPLDSYEYGEVVVKPYLGNIKVRLPSIYKTKSIYLEPENTSSSVTVYETYYFHKGIDSGVATIQFSLGMPDSISNESESYRYEFMEQKIRLECFIKDTLIRSFITLNKNKAYIVSFNSGFYLECFTEKGMFSVLLDKLENKNLKEEILKSVRLEDWSWRD